MGRRGRFADGNGTKKRKKIRSTEKISDGSDEDYVVGDDESDDDNSEEEYCASSSQEFSEESFDFDSLATSCSGGSSSEGRKVVRPKRRKGFTGWRKIGTKQKKCRVSRVLDDSDGGDDDEDGDEEFMPDADDCLDDEEENWVTIKKRVPNQVTRRKGPPKGRKMNRKLKKNTKKKKKNASNKRLVKSDLKVLSSDDDFVVEDTVVPEKNIKKGRKGKKTAVSSDEDFVVDNTIALEKNERKGRKRKKTVVSSDDDFVVEDTIVPKKNKKKGRLRKKRTTVHLESDDSGSTDFEYTVSEEEREFIRELASNGSPITCLRSSSLSKSLPVDTASPCQEQGAVTRKGRKGKEKVDDSQLDMGKQVCGICLTEEHKDTVRGTLNSCFHYFCFTCIMEWSKVESRCPVCKQRFTTISKSARSITGIGLRESVIRVPRRDQVYRPSEEEMRGYLDPYENMVCMMCQQGGDDSLMLLCDICDSPAHTYCVGLGREVPEGNWYCEGCKSSEPVSSNSHVQNLVLDQSTNNSGMFSEHFASGNDAEDFDTHSRNSSSQHPVLFGGQAMSLGMDMRASPRYVVGDDIQVASPISRLGASTVLVRRRLRRRIHNLISSTYRMNQSTEITERTNGMLHSSLASNVVTTDVQQNHLTVENPKSLGSGVSHSVAFEGRVHDSERSNFLGETPTSSVQNGDGFSARVRHPRKQVIHDLNVTPVDDDGLWDEQEMVTSSHAVSGYQQYGQPTTGSSAQISSYVYGEGCSSGIVDEAKERQSHSEEAFKDFFHRY